MKNWIIVSMVLTVMSCKNNFEALNDRDISKSARVEADSSNLIFPLANEKFFIQPEIIDSLKGKSILFRFISETKFGCANNKLLIKREFVDQNKIRIGIGDNLIIKPGCQGEKAPAQEEIHFYFNHEGVYELVIHLGESNYTGQLNYHKGRYLITWPDNTPFRFSEREVYY
jgi:hypothetical protein